MSIQLVTLIWPFQIQSAGFITIIIFYLNLFILLYEVVIQMMLLVAS